jgi:uncharacterized pyridoxal phosphate-containing UPF0001 family protein
LLQQVLSVPNLDCVETVDSVKLATALDKAAAAAGRAALLSILVQVNTSGEESTSFGTTCAASVLIDAEACLQTLTISFVSLACSLAHASAVVVCVCVVCAGRRQERC